MPTRRAMTPSRRRAFLKAWLGGNTIWMRGFQQEMRTSTSTAGGGKGRGTVAPSRKNVSYHDYADIAIGRAAPVNNQGDDHPINYFGS